MHLKYLFYLFLGTFVWGLSPIFYAILHSVSSIEIVAHRSLWSAVFLIIYLYLFSGLGRELFQKGVNELWLLFLSGILIAINWYGFIFAVNSGNALQASLGYYIFPLVAVFLGIIFNREKFTILQIFAICLVIIAVISKLPWSNILNLCKKERQNLNVKHVNIDVIIKVLWINTFFQSMKEKSHSNV